MELLNLSEELKNNAYPGRGIVIGKTPDGKRILLWAEAAIPATACS